LVRRLILIVLAALGLWGGGLSASIPLKGVVVSPPPIIDGDLSDPCWESVPAIADFYNLEAGVPAPEKTTVRLAYDENNVYVAFDCKDSCPDAIQAQQKKRGGEMLQDDYVSLRLDLSSDLDGKYSHFTVNAAGTRSHSVQSPETGGKSEWIGDWDAATRQDPSGYAVEMRIPFAILWYDQQDPRISLAFVRQSPRYRQEWWAPDLGNAKDPRKLYFWEGVRPRIRKPRPFTMLYALAGLGSDVAPTTAGLDIKHSLTQGLNGLLTLNPDFATIEQAVDRVDFTYTERALNDQRPFFLEGQQYFPGASIFYTRRIRDIDLGTKVVGLAGDYKLAFLNAVRFGHESYTVGHVNRRWGKDFCWSAWAGGVLSDVEGKQNLVGLGTIGYTWRLPAGRLIRAQFDVTNSDSADGKGHGAWNSFMLRDLRGAGEYTCGIVRSTIDSDFDPFLGITTEKGLRRWNGWVYKFGAPAEGRISYWEYGIEALTVDHLDGSLYYNGIVPFVTLSRRSGQSISASYWSSNRPPNHDRYWHAEYGWGQKDLYRGGGIGVSMGSLVGGDYIDASLTQGVHLTDRLSAQVRTEYFRIEEPSIAAGTSRQFILSANYDISPERNIVGRLIRERGTTNMYFAYRQRVRAGLDAFLIYGDPNALETRNTLMVKLVQPLR
jgi:hypothetical protein